ncbi:hypothetical protein HPP92_005286 [Vanilla planifolia]|uniref:K Homology domain-containing protein n=1 Tax=Vanilla planifolia TaxID=51239 RepID=A0A835VC14_VANPL|nr:hypothetical protein HPP92_005286 [Vanilla planifolia]
MSEEVVGEGRCVKNAVEIISSRLKESLHRDRGPFRGRAHSPDRYFSPDDDLIGNTQYQPAMDGSDIGSRSSAGPTRVRSNAYVEAIVSPTDGIIEMLQNDVGVDVRVTDAVDGSEERIILITSDEGPEDELFPAQEALLHLQTHIVDLGPDKDNIITTRLLVSAREIGCFEGKDGLSDFNSSTCANVQILSKEGLSLCASETDEIIQIVGDIQEARKALVQITSKLRSYLYREILMSKETLLPPAQAISHAVKVFGLESTPTRSSSHNEGYQGNDPLASFENVRAPSANWSSKETVVATSSSLEPEQNFVNESGKQSALKRFSTPLVTKSTLEVVIPENAVPSLIMKSGSKLAQISEMSGANVTLLPDKPDSTEKIVQISGTPDQAERAQSLLQGFILSTL